ncbi:MAG: hypothetical protein GY702_06750 [Desulfobulbaceae bacterium]|nr:hypothetical protein [Desulfobulbaceae bacterium]
MNEPGTLDERLPTLVMQSFEGGGERLPLSQPQSSNTVLQESHPERRYRLCI